MNYFRELIEKIREIRLEEKVFYQQIKDIYKTSIDYDPSDEMTILFFKEEWPEGQVAGTIPKIHVKFAWRGFVL